MFRTSALIFTSYPFSTVSPSPFRWHHLRTSSSLPLGNSQRVATTSRHSGKTSLLPVFLFVLVSCAMLLNSSGHHVRVHKCKAS